MMGWHHADRSTFSVHIKTVGITGEEWISASYLSLIETNGFMFPASLFNLFFPNRHFIFEQGRNKGELTLLIVLQVQCSFSFSSSDTFCFTCWQTRSRMSVYPLCWRPAHHLLSTVAFLKL